ncbi:MAG: hypothetical protein J6386_14730 [Candidatus Synoicihabitans palmerolidicus]|nr:hypothetical protein [Candidatus Synoicihabitans palmerolidicus]
MTTWFVTSGEDPRALAQTGDEAESKVSPSVEMESAAQEKLANPLAKEDLPSIEIVEALFEEYRDWAFWSDGRTQVAVWNSANLGFSDHFEIVRTDDGYYFRPILRFTRLPLEGYGPPNSPVLFTETAEQRAKRFIAANPSAAPKPVAPEPLKFKELPRPPSSGS